MRRSRPATASRPPRLGERLATGPVLAAEQQHEDTGLANCESQSPGCDYRRRADVGDHGRKRAVTHPILKNDRELFVARRLGKDRVGEREPGLLEAERLNLGLGPKYRTGIADREPGSDACVEQRGCGVVDHLPDRWRLPAASCRSCAVPDPHRAHRHQPAPDLTRWHVLRRPDRRRLDAQDVKELRSQELTFRCHSFKLACADLDIEHRLTKPRHPWANRQRLPRRRPGSSV